MIIDIAHGAEDRPRKRKADPNQWRKNAYKNKRSKGQPYVGKKYEKGSKKFEMVEKPGKMLGERCHCKTAGAKCFGTKFTTKYGVCHGHRGKSS